MQVELPKNLKKLLKQKSSNQVGTNNIFFLYFLRRMGQAKRARAVLADKSLNLSQYDQSLLMRFYVENYSSAWAWLLSPTLGILLAGIGGQIVEDEFGRFWSTTVALSLLTGSFGYFFAIKATVVVLLKKIKAPPYLNE